MIKRDKPDKPKRERIRPPDPRQLKFLELYMDPDSLSYGNALQSALRAGYSENYGKQIASISLNWLTENNRKSNGPSADEIVDRLWTEAKEARASKDRIRGLEILAKIQKLFSDGTNVQINQAFGVSVTVSEMDDKQLDKVIEYGFSIISPGRKAAPSGGRNGKDRAASKQ